MNYLSFTSFRFHTLAYRVRVFEHLLDITVDYFRGTIRNSFNLGEINIVCRIV